MVRGQLPQITCEDFQNIHLECRGTSLLSLRQYKDVSLWSCPKLMLQCPPGQAASSRNYPVSWVADLNVKCQAFPPRTLASGSSETLKWDFGDWRQCAAWGIAVCLGIMMLSVTSSYWWSQGLQGTWFCFPLLNMLLGTNKNTFFFKSSFTINNSCNQECRWNPSPSLPLLSFFPCSVWVSKADHYPGKRKRVCAVAFTRRSVGLGQEQEFPTQTASRLLGMSSPAPQKASLFPSTEVPAWRALEAAEGGTVWKGCFFSLEYTVILFP